MTIMDSSSFTDKILAASSIAFECVDAEIEFAFTEKFLENCDVKNRILDYATRHSRDGFEFDGYLYLVYKHTKVLDRVTPKKPIENFVKDFLAYISAIGRPESLLDYCLFRVKLRLIDLLQIKSEEVDDRILTVTILIENDNSYEFKIEGGEGEEENLEQRFDGLFQSRLKLVRSFTK
ncbi:MAG: hypothetical protein QXN62_00690 [Candidatus Bathyarchaeia archaeon]|nr:hypothetical protein [Candidatus Bathyarchaeota archaeon]